MKGLTEKQNLLLAINTITGLSGLERVKTTALKKLLDYINSKENVEEEIPGEEKYKAIIRQTKYEGIIPAIKEYRKDHGVGLKEAVAVIRGIKAEMESERSS